MLCTLGDKSKVQMSNDGWNDVYSETKVDDYLWLYMMTA